jgi:tetratricopeptide (TPR) repeat protein
VDAFLAQAGPLAPAQVAAVLRADQRGRWRAGDPVPAEDYLRRHPAVAADPDGAADLIYNEFLLREARGERPDPDEYARRFPQHADLLRAQIDLHREMAAGPGDCAATLRAAGPDGPPGATDRGQGPARPAVPGYEVLGELGRGGMGVVYKARQTSLNRVVALKMLLAGAYADPEQRRRLRAEAEAVARLRHPNIVQIFEVGEHDGRPYLVLEYVEGGALDEALAGTPQNPRAAAAVAETLARAAHAAHQQGVVHRDLKSANVLLAYGREPPAGASRLTEAVPKIADFGLAKQLDAGPRRTPSEAILGTPSYMAPEQASGKMRAVGPAADVYALGAILYEMLTGRPPFRGETPLDTLQQVLIDDPVPPRALQPKVPTDLATVCLKCLQKDPARRYASAGDLAEDLSRFLHGEPIKARPVGPAARLYRWCRRKPATAGLLALLVVGTAVSTWQAVRATAAEHERDRQRVAAQEEADNARAVLDFLNDNVLGQASAYKQAGAGAAPDPDLKVRTALDRAAAGVAGKFAGRPRVEIAVRTALGSAYYDVSAYDAARAQLEEAVRLSGETLGEDHPDTLKATNLLGRVYLDQGKYDEAEALFTRARDGYGRLHGEAHADTLAARSNLANVAQARGDLDRAEGLYAEVLAAERLALGDMHEGTRATSLNLALLYQTRGKFDEAERLLAAVIEAEGKAFGDGDLRTFAARRNLAALYQAEGQNEKALPYLRDAFEAARRAFGDEHEDTCAARNNLAVCRLELGQLAEAEALLTRNLEVQTRHLGEDHPHTLATLGSLGALYFTRGEYAKAEPLYAKSLAILRRTAAADSPDVLVAINGLAAVYYGQRKYADAEPLYQEALAGCRKVLGEEHPNTLLVTQSLAALYRDWGKDAKAEPLFEQVRAALARRPGGTEDPQTAKMLVSLGLIRLRRQKAAEAEPLLREAVRVYEKQKPEAWYRFDAQSRLGQCLAAQAKYDDAEPLVLTGYEGLRQRAKEIPADTNSLAEAGERVVRLYEAWGKPEKVAEWRAKLAGRPEP